MGKLYEEKKQLADLIVEHLAAVTSYREKAGAMNVLKEKLMKSRIELLRQLSTILSTVPPRKESAEDYPDHVCIGFPPVPLHLQGIDVLMPKNADEAEKQILTIPGMSDRLHNYWRKGDMPGMKRFLGCINKATSNIEKFLKQQLWDSVKPLE